MIHNVNNPLFKVKAGGILLLSAVALVGCDSSSKSRPTTSAEPEATYQAEVRVTDYGVPHVKADDYAGLGFGIGYASARDTLCELAERVVTTNAQRTLYFGASDSNISSDLYYQYLLDTREIENILDGDPESVETPSTQARDHQRGVAAGTNHYIRETGIENLPDPRCRGEEWVREVTELDLWRPARVSEINGIVAAQPPGASTGRSAAMIPDDEPLPDPETIGSNAYGLGTEVTANGQGMLLANPHYPWAGENRFYRMHLTIPGEFNVVGAGLINTGRVGIGHNETMAWTHTVSTARRYGYFELKLNPEDPTQYLYEGEYLKMGEHTVTIQTRQSDGSMTPVSGTIYTTRFGPMITTSTYPWTTDRGFAIRTFLTSLRSTDQYFAIFKAKDVRELFDALGQYQATTFNTIAADSTGETFLGDAGAVPHVTEAKAADCIISDLGRNQWDTSRIPVLDGSRAACEWGTDPDSAVPGTFSVNTSPHLFRDDYVHQANDSHWLSNPNDQLEGYSRIFGDEQTQRSLRTRMGLRMIEDRLDGTDGLPGNRFDLSSLQKVMYGDRNLSAELARDDLVALCQQTKELVVDGETVDLMPACAVLEEWDLRVNTTSRGAHLWRQFVVYDGLQWQLPFDVNDPVNTPNTLDTADERVLTALGKAVLSLEELNLPLNSEWGDVQFVTRDGERLPIHGGSGAEGIFNVIWAQGPVEDKGWPEVVTGASWIMAVEFTENGPKSAGVLTYSQTANTESPHHADQTRLYSQYGWDDLRISEEAVMVGTVNSYVVSEGETDCLVNGWVNFSAPAFNNEKECVSYFATLRDGATLNP